MVVECAAFDGRGADADIAPDRASRAEQVGPNSEGIGATLAGVKAPKLDPHIFAFVFWIGGADRGEWGKRNEANADPISN